MTLSTFKGFMDGVRAAYLHACEKHPVFTDMVCHHDLDGIRSFLYYCRDYNEKNTPDFVSILDEEIGEYAEASLLGDTEAAKRELLDCAAVLMREWERINTNGND